MNSSAVSFFLYTAIGLLLLPRRWAPIPLLAGVCYMTLGQGVQFGSFNFPLLRLLIGVGVVRVVVRREGLTMGTTGLDRLMVVFAAVALLTSPLHRDPAEQFEFSLGLAYNTCGTYFLFRVFCQSIRDVQRLSAVVVLMLVPVAAEMLNEVLTGQNFFSVFGGVVTTPVIREGNIRAQGPFAHPILAGTVGAVCWPISAGLWRQSKAIAMIGMTSCVIMVITASSSGPIATLLVGWIGLFMWYWRQQMRVVRWGAVLAYVALDIVMKAPPYYLMGRIDLAGGSTGWHRAELINTGVQHLSEWWLWGTDYTRHWMPSGVSWSPDHADITNHYLHIGIIGGLPLMALFIATLAKGFSFVGHSLQSSVLRSDQRFLVWTLGVSLFGHTVTCLSVAYFDQSFVFLYLILAVIASTWCAVCNVTSENGEEHTRGVSYRPLVPARIEKSHAAPTPGFASAHTIRTNQSIHRR